MLLFLELWWEKLSWYFSDSDPIGVSCFDLTTLDFMEWIDFSSMFLKDLIELLRLLLLEM